MYVVKKPEFSDHIRVNRGLYYHHGIYVNDETVIQFASLIEGHETDPEYASICISTLEKFAKGSEVEVYEYTDEELKIKRSPNDIVSYAYSRLGEKGYDLINNNCEHFANECTLGKKESEQVNNVLNIFKGLFGGFNE